MVDAILQFFVDEEKVAAILSHGFIEFIFIVLIVTFVFTLLIHLSIFNKLRTLRNHLRVTNRMDVVPLHQFKDEFDYRQSEESVQVETFVQEKFSSWKLFNLPVVNLIKFVQSTVSIFILVGVLGTFIGLTISLGSIDATGDQLLDDVASVLSGIDVAFYTSITGMGFSLLMTLFIKIFNTEYLLTDLMLKVESNLEESEQNNLGRLIDVAESINGSLSGLQQNFQGFQDYTIGLERSAHDLKEFNEGLSHNLKDFNMLFTSMKKATVGFEASTAKLNKNFDQLFNYFKQMDHRNEEMNTTFENTYRKIAEIASTQENTLKYFEDSVTDLKKYTSSMLQEQQTLKGTFETINSKNYDLVEKLDQHNRDFKRIFGDDLSGKLTGINTHLVDLAKDFNQLGDSIVHLPDALKMINQTQTEYKHLLSDRFEELKQFNKDFSDHLKAHTSDSALFEKKLNEATDTYEQIGLKNNQLINEINRSIEQMNQSFTQRENQLENNVGLLKDTLSKYVDSLEGTLGDKLDKVIRNIGNSMDITNDGIKKEFREIRMLTEEIQQNSMRTSQQMIQELQEEVQKLNHNLKMSNHNSITPKSNNNHTGWNKND